MECWCQLVVSYPESPDPKHLGRALRIAETLLTTDLAPFEIEWLIQTFFSKPVNVFTAIQTNKVNDIWLKNIADAFKIISKMVSKYWTYLEKDSRTFVELCSLTFDALTKKEAINCLINVLTQPGVVVGDARKHVDALDGAVNCKAPLALLVGTICRHYPERVEQEYNRVWRIYLRMLQPQNITDTIVNAVLQGIDGLFENFGRNLPMQELNDFYADFSRKCPKMSKCIPPLLSILKSHASLFKEKLAEDQVLRLFLWGINSPNISDALLNTYSVIFEDMPERKIKDIIRSEIQFKLESESYIIRHTALRILFHAKINHKVQIFNTFRPDELEFQMRYRAITHQDAELISICLKSSENYVRSLLATCITYYDNIPVTYRQRIVVQGILEASVDDRKMVLNLLIELSRQDGGLEKYADVWRGLINSDDNSNNILKEILLQMEGHLLTLLDTPLKDDQVLSLTGVLSFVLSASEIEARTQYIAMFECIIIKLAAAMYVSPTSLLISKYMSEEMFQQNTILKELLTSLQYDKEDTLSAIQLIFNKDVLDNKLLIKTLSEMDTLLKENNNLDDQKVSYIMKHIVKLKSRRHTPSVDSRILQRNVTMFLGEHGRYIAKDNFVNNASFMEMKNKITITIPNVTEGIYYKIDLLKVLQHSLVSEDSEMLYCLLVIISASLRDRPDPGLQILTWKCIYGLLKDNVDVDVTSALRMCATVECVRQVVDSISNEINPEVRRKLCDSLQVLLNEDPGSERSGQLLTFVVEQLLMMIDNPKLSTYECGLDIVRVILPTLQHNDSLTLQYLPQIISKTSIKINYDIYKTATNLFIDKCDIFDSNQIDKMAAEIVNKMEDNYNKIHLEYILSFLKKVFDIKGINNCRFLNNLDNCLSMSKSDGVFANILQILALNKQIFGFDYKKTASAYFCEFRVIEAILNQIVDILSVENVSFEILSKILMYLKEFAVELLDINKEHAIECFGKFIENLSPYPTNLSLLKEDISLCLKLYKKDSNLNRYYSKWCDQMKINEINDIMATIDISDIFFIKDKMDIYLDNVKCLSILCEVFKSPIPITKDWTAILIANEGKLRENIVADLLKISLRSLANFEEIFNKKNESFFIKYLNVYFESIMDVGNVLDKDLFMAIVKIFGNNYKKYENYYEKMLDILVKTWPKLEQESFEDKLSITSSFLRVPRDVEGIPPVQWVISVITDPNGNLDHKIKLITMLPGGEAYSTCYRHIAGSLPTRLSEMRGEHASLLRALLDSLATTGDLCLLDIIVTLSAADDTKGWWDDAFNACMTSLADRRDEKIYDAAFEGCKKRYSLGGCRRVLVPLLRHSTWTFCEKYTSKIIVDLLAMLKTGFKEPTDSEVYRTRVLLYAQAFSILQVVIEKLPAKNLESGMINVSAGSQDPWHVVKMVCMYSVTLRDKVRCPDNASDGVKDACLRLQCAAYNCLVSAICKRQPPQKQYVFIFGDNVWSKIVDTDAEYDFQPVAYSGDIKRTQSDGSSAASTSFTGTVRTRIFMATLSENPLQYDMIPLDEDEEDVEEQKPLAYEAHPLNAHGCLVAITGLLEHASTLDHTEWLTKLTEGLRSGMPLNAKWTLAQAICNAQMDLVSHASVLAPALLELIATTPKTIGDKQLLNNLHIDILWTIIKWNILELASYDYLNTCVEYLLVTCIEYRGRDSVSRRLLATLNSVLAVYGSKVKLQWKVFQIYCNDLPNNAWYLMPIFQRILKNGIPLPELLPVIAKCDVTQWANTSKLPEVFGLALSLETNKDDMLRTFWKVLANVKAMNISKFVKVLLYAQRVCHQCCNQSFFRIITDLAPKAEKSKCLTIISLYLDNLVEDDGSCLEMFETIALKDLIDSDYSIEAMKVVHGGFKFMEDHMRKDIVSLVANNCRSSSNSVRKQALIVILKAFQDLVLIKDQHGPKRIATGSSPILNTMRSQISYQRIVVEETCRGMFDIDEELAKIVRDGVETCLSKDMALRSAELFYLIFYFANYDRLLLSDYGYVFLDLLFRDLRQQEAFKNTKISDNPLPTSDVSFAIHSTSGMSLKKQFSKVNARRDINVQMNVADIFEVFLQSAKDNTQLCQELCVQILRRLQGTGRRFDLDEVIAEMLGDVLKKEPNCLTPLFIEVSRIFLSSVSSVVGFRNSLSDLKMRIHSSVAISYLNILYEDLLLMSEGRELFNFGDKESDVEMNYETEEFSIQSLINSFGHLSNWDNLTIQDRRHIEKSLPPLLVKREQFECSLKDYFKGITTPDYKSWFNKMVGAYYLSKGEPVIQYKEDWLRDIERWPVKDFVTSSIIEAVDLTKEVGSELCDIGKSDCLVEWAARLMVRSAYQGDNNKNYELKWCSEANKRNLPHLALQCINRNKDLLLENEAWSWFYEKVQAERLIELRKDDVSSRIPKLKTVLDRAERQDTKYMFCFEKLILQLRIETQEFPMQHYEDIIERIKNISASDTHVYDSAEKKHALKSIYELAMSYFHCTARSDAISLMIDIIHKCVELNVSNDYNLLLCILLNTLANFNGVLDHDSADKILNKITFMLPNLDIFTIEQIRSVSRVFPHDVWSQYPRVQNAEESLNVCKEYLQLIRDPMYTLLQYCDSLNRLIYKDADSWKEMFEKMKKILFSSCYGGTDYVSLTTMKNKLYKIENGGIDEKRKVLKSLLDELPIKSQRPVLLLSQLSPQLARSETLETQRENLRKLLSLPSNIYVVKFNEQIQFFRDSVRRPCTVSVVLSNGVTKRYIIKTGEPLANDASVQRAIAILPKIYNGQVRSYKVTTLSEESAIIEWLEDHERLRDVMGEQVNVPVNRLVDDKLVLSPSIAQEQYTVMCNKLPVHTLRSSIENRCATLEEFIYKKQMFLETLSTMTITNWLFGVGDRHLQNIMYNKKDGSVCGVDWASTFQYGLREYVPARLTGNLLAVCDVKVLESRLQKMLARLRNKHVLYEAFVTTSFGWTKADFNKKSYIGAILEGRTNSYNITNDVIKKSELRHKEECINILDSVLEKFVNKDTYSVEEQISCLLQHCTSPKLLSVIPRGWEPWI